MRVTTGKLFFFLILCVSWAGFGFSTHSAIWEKPASGIFEPDIHAIAIDPKDPATLFVATSKALYKSTNRGRTYMSILQTSGQNSAINDVFIDPDQPRFIYAAANTGAYLSDDAGRSWRQIHSPSQEQARNCLSITKYNDVIYIGTLKGLFEMSSSEKTPKRAQYFPSEPVHQLSSDSHFLYIATNNDVYQFNPAFKKLKKVFSAGLNHPNESAEDEQGENTRTPMIRRMVNVKPFGHLVVATGSGLFISPNYEDLFDPLVGKEWIRIRTDTLDMETITSVVAIGADERGFCLAAERDCFEILVGTSRGAFLYQRGVFEPLYRGMEASEINFLTVDNEGQVYAATDLGIFTLKNISQLFPAEDKGTRHQDAANDTRNNGIKEFDYGQLSGKLKNDPEINRVQDWAVDYAEVAPEKISEWRRLARKRAWFPDLSIGIDENYGWDWGDSIWGTSSGKHYIGPDDKAFGHDLGWDVSMSWDLGDLIWSTDQTTIDSRSKLMVELREDILNQITRLYFERRRIQLELMTAQVEPVVLLDRQMRIEELTALIDGMTGGKFSEALRKNAAKERED